MTATDTIRAMLDERGVEYEPIDSVHSPNRRTLWGKVERGKGIFGLDAKYETIEFKKGMRLTISDCSPEQAIEATLGGVPYSKPTVLSDLQAENAELRELVRDLYECVSHANEQDWFYFERHMLGCGMSCTVNGEGCGLSVLADRMRELGIEV